MPVSTRYAMSTLDGVEAAVKNLQEREGAPTVKAIGVIAGTTQTDYALQQHPHACGCIRAWAEQLSIDAVIWTAIGPRFVERTGVPFSVDAAIHYLQSLAEPTKTMALEYIENRRPKSSPPLRIQGARHLRLRPTGTLF